MIGLTVICCQNSEEHIYSSIKSPKSGQMIVLDSRMDSIEISGLTAADLRLIRNEIFARHGYIFTSKDLTAYFSKFDWYEPAIKADKIDDKLNQIDQFNIELIKSIEKLKNNKSLKWDSDIQEYLELIPTIELPFDFVCEENFKPAELNHEIDIIKKYKPEGAVIIAKIYQDDNEAAIIYGYPADIFLPLISIIDKTGKEIKEVRLFKLADCVDDKEYSARTYGTITGDYQIKLKTVVIPWNKMDANGKQDTIITNNTIYIKTE